MVAVLDGTKVKYFYIFFVYLYSYKFKQLYLCDMNTTKKKICSSCDSEFSCGDVSIVNKCWCNDFPPIFNLSEGGDCLCPVCFKEACEDKIDAYVETLSPEKALQNKAKDLPKTEILIEGIDYYLENGNMVFKTWYHLKRGTCCGNNCRHCPY